VGVYHFMGLGRSVGAVTGPLSYLGHRFQRWNNTDREFFGASGEECQRVQGEKVGDVQALVLFTTAEVLDGTVQCYPYCINQPGLCPKGVSNPQSARPIRGVLHDLLPKILRPLAKGRNCIKLYWCRVDRTDLLATFRHAARVLLAAKSVGSLGKETWFNLTGGNNVTNLALQLSAALTGSPARFYYVQAQNPDAEKCIHYTHEESYFVDLPLLPIRPHEASRHLVELVVERGSIETPALFTQAKEQHWSQIQDAENLDQFRNQYVRPLLFQELITTDGEMLRPGRRWPLMRPYYETLDAIDGSVSSLGNLAKNDWFEEEDLPL